MGKMRSRTITYAVICGIAIASISIKQSETSPNINQELTKELTKEFVKPSEVGKIPQVFRKQQEVEIVTEPAPEEVVIPETETPTEPEEPKPFFYLTEEERKTVECMVMGESGGEPYEGKVLVAQCILNACIRSEIQPSEVRKAYKYSGYNTNVSDSVKQAVADVFDNGEFVVDEPILYFYAWKRGYKGWHESQDFVIQVGGHRFFKEVCADEG